MSQQMNFHELGINIADVPLVEGDPTHVHPEFELNVIISGRVVYDFSGERFEWQKGDLILFSGLLPHRVIDFDEGTRMFWLTLPIAHFIHWSVRDDVLQDLLTGHSFVSSDFGERVFNHILDWKTDFESGDPRQLSIALLEVRALVERLFLRQVARSSSREKSGRSVAQIQKVAQLMYHILHHYHDDLNVEGLSEIVGWHPDTTSRTFSKVVGVKLMDYINQQRVHVAKHLLSSRQDNILDVALQSGFQSSSRFYEVFKKHSSLSPKEFRKSFSL